MVKILYVAILYHQRHRQQRLYQNRYFYIGDFTLMTIIST